MQEVIDQKIERHILLNPGPATTSATVKKSLVVSDICPREEEFSKLLKDVSSKCLKVVNAPAHYKCVLLPGPGTASVESALSFNAHPDKKILILANGAYGQRMIEICQALSIKYQSLEFSWENELDYQKIDTFLNKEASNFHALAFVHHETTVGVLNDLSKIYEISKKYQLTSIADCMSSYAGIPIDLKDTPVDVIVSSSNKCIQGMAGLGIIIVNSNLVQKNNNQNVGSYTLNLIRNYQAQIDNNEFIFTPPVQVLYALKQALIEFEAETQKGRSKRYFELYDKMAHGMRELGFEFLINPKVHSKILTAFKAPTFKGYTFLEFHDFLFERKITIYPGKMASKNYFRISNLGDLNHNDIDVFLSAVKDYLHKKSPAQLYG